MISEGHKEWNKWDQMICNHMDPHKIAKHPDLLGTPIAYMESWGTFKAIKSSEYGLSHFYQVGITGDFPAFPESQEPMTSNDICHLLKKVHEQAQPNLVVAPSQDAVMAIALLHELLNHNSLPGSTHSHGSCFSAHLLSPCHQPRGSRESVRCCDWSLRQPWVVVGLAWLLEFLHQTLRCCCHCCCHCLTPHCCCRIPTLAARAFVVGALTF